VLIPQILAAVIPSPQFEAATIANIDSRFGTASASDAFYKRIFDLYKAAPGASSAIPGSFFPEILDVKDLESSDQVCPVPCISLRIVLAQARIG